jgi:hypothetical protein
MPFLNLFNGYQVIGIFSVFDKNTNRDKVIRSPFLEWVQFSKKFNVETGVPHKRKR